tara:strand:+ start:1369 stop:2022 length:654 start_codon:yes stop_codon:yes gene_type:complete
MNVVDNFLPDRYHKELIEMIASNNFPWFYHESMSYLDKKKPHIVDKNIKETSQFVHFFMMDTGTFNCSDYWERLKPMFWLLADKANVDYKRIVRCKANLILREDGFQRGQYNFPHTDINEINGKEYTTALYYLIDSDGPTYIFDENLRDDTDKDIWTRKSNPLAEKEYAPLPKSVHIKEKSEVVENRLVYFDAYQYHASSNPIDHPRRIVINLLMEL